MGEPCRLSMKKSLYLKVIGLFVIINIPKDCDGILMDL